MELGAVNLPTSLEVVRITKLPPSAFYIADFISEDEEQAILQKVRKSWPRPLRQPVADHYYCLAQQIAEAPKPRWKQLTHRRLQTWPSDLVQNKLIDAPLPPWLQEPVVSRILSLPRATAPDSSNLFTESPHQRPNHVLINEYPPGVGIMPHKMDPPIIQYKEDGALDPEPVWRILQEPRSLLITTDNLYTDYLHGIADTDEDVELSADSIVNWDLLRSKDHYATGRNVRATRTSLTYRDVMQVSKLGAKFGLFGKK
ncbi:calpain [Colletotrichum camelliae]|nr:calpain [Colletotrichum camelliae]